MRSPLLRLCAWVRSARYVRRHSSVQGACCVWQIMFRGRGVFGMYIDSLGVGAVGLVALSKATFPRPFVRWTIVVLINRNFSGNNPSRSVKGRLAITSVCSYWVSFVRPSHTSCLHRRFRATRNHEPGATSFSCPQRQVSSPYRRQGQRREDIHFEESLRDNGESEDIQD